MFLAREQARSQSIEPSVDLSLCRPGLRSSHELHRRRIHAITQSCRSRAIIEDMAQMRIALAALDLRTRHAKTIVDNFDHILFCNRLPKAGPASAGFEFGF